MYMKYLAILLFLLLPSIHAVDLNQELSDEEKETFDEMLTPVMKVYNFVKYVTTVIAALYLLFVGIQFMTAGSDQRKHDDDDDDNFSFFGDLFDNLVDSIEEVPEFFLEYSLRILNQSFEPFLNSIKNQLGHNPNIENNYTTWKIITFLRKP